MRRAALVLLALAGLLAGAPVQAQEAGWLDRFNRAMHDINLSARSGLAGLTEQLPAAPSLPADVRSGAGNLINTWIGNPWQAMALGLAGRPEDARAALDRSWTNIVQGRGGLDDAAAQAGLPRPPAADIGLALCAHGVPEGPYVVFPFVGGRTLRDGLSDLVVANAVIYTALLPVIGTAPSLELIVALQVLDNVPIWLLADRMGRVDGVASVEPDLDALRAAYLAARRQACEALRAPR